MQAVERRFAAALEICAEAASLAERMQPPPGAPAASEKSAQDWVTEADSAVERLVLGRLRRLFPGDAFLGEEGGASGGDAAGTVPVEYDQTADDDDQAPDDQAVGGAAAGARQERGHATGRAGIPPGRGGRLGGPRAAPAPPLLWILDPIDGTANFARGRAHWCVSLGLIAEAEPVAGVVAAPAQGETFAAVRGRGATRNGAPIRVAETAALSRAMVEFGWSPRTATADFVRITADLLAAGVMLRNGGSGALGMVDVAIGRQDAFVELTIYPWDVAGAIPILCEAGAVVRPFPLGIGQTARAPAFAATPGIAEPLLALTGLG